MDLGASVLSMMFKLVMILAKPVLKILMWTGLYIPVAYLIVLSIFFPSVFGARAGTTADHLSTIGLIITLVMAACIFIRNFLRLVTRNPNISILGLFKGLKSKDIGKFKLPAELLTGKGVIFGKEGKKYISKPEILDGSTLVIGGAGSGKSSCVAIPTLLNWEGSVFAIDLKGELSKTVRNFRPNMKVFNPVDHETIPYNPMKALKEAGRNRVQAAQSIAKAIIPLPPDVKDPFWITSAQNLLTAALLHYCNQYDFPKIMRTVQGTNIDELIKILANSPDEDSRLFANPLSGLDTKVTSGIFMEISNNIVSFATDGDLLNALKSSSDSISPVDVENGKDVFIRIPEDKLDIWKNLLTVIVTQFLRSFERLPDGNDKPILLILDEFARLGKIEGIMNALSTLRSKNVHIVILTQSLAQLDAIYSRDNRKIICDNCSYKFVLRATDAETQDYFSKMVGTHDVQKTSTSSNFDLIGLGKGGGKTVSDQERKIIKPEEFAFLEKPVLFTPYGIFRPEKAPYYREPLFLKRQHENRSQTA